MEEQQKATSPDDMLMSEYRGQMSDMMHAFMAMKVNFQIAAAGRAATEKELAAARARITELETTAANAVKRAAAPAASTNADYLPPFHEDVAAVEVEDDGA